MEVLLIDPHWKNSHGFFGPNIGLGYIASVLERKEIRVKIMDFIGDESTLNSFEEFQNLERKFIEGIQTEIASGEYTVVGITCSIGAYKRTLEIAQACKEANENIVVVIGGPHVTSMDTSSTWRNQIFEDSNVIDAVVRGEGELTIREMIDSLSKKNFNHILGVTFRENGKIVRNQDRPLIKDLNNIPFPAWHFFNMESYPPVLYIVASRGCKYNCAFCDEPTYWRKVYRFRSARNVVDEIENDIRRYGVRNFRFTDASFTGNPALLDICKGIMKKRLTIRWNAFAHNNEVDTKKLEAMKKAGCTLLEIGIESGNQDILNKMRKGFTVERVKRSIKLAKKVGIPIRGSFIVGFPGETEKTALQTIEFAKSLQLEAYSWHSLMPSIEMFNNAKKWGLTVNVDWKSFNADVPDRFLSDMLRRVYDVVIEPHTASRMAKQKSKVPRPSKKDLMLHDTMSIAQMFRLVRIAVDETKRPALESDYFYL